MTMESLQSDMAEISSAAKVLGPLSTVGEIAAFIKSNLVPYLDSQTAEMAEMDGCIADLLGEADDILQPETAKIFAGVIVGGPALIARLLELVPKPHDEQLVKAVSEYKHLCDQAGAMLEEITVDVGEDEDQDQDEDDDEDDKEPT